MTQFAHAAGAVSATLEQSEELRRIHAAVTDRGLPIALKDDFHAQCEEIERAVGGDAYRRARRRARALNAASLVIALPVLAAAVLVIVFDRFVDGADPFAWLFEDMTRLIAVTAVAAVLIIAVLACSIALRATNRRLLGRVYPELLARAGLA